MKTGLIIMALLLTALVATGCDSENNRERFDNYNLLRGVTQPPSGSGANGSQGAQGPAGTPGSNGTNGVNGTGVNVSSIEFRFGNITLNFTGMSGLQSFQGPNLTGPVGATGNTGATGDAGAPGAQGAAGTNGTNGANITSLENKFGILIINLSDGRSYNLSNTTGAQGAAGAFDIQPFFSEDYYFQRIGFESVTAAILDPWAPAALGSGTTALVAGTRYHPGTASVSTSATASSGYSYQITGATTYLLAPNYTTTLDFKPVTKAPVGNPGIADYNKTNIYFGFMDVFTGAIPVDGVFINVTQISGWDNRTNFTVNGIAITDVSKTSTTTMGNLRNNTWYKATVYIRNNTLAEFTIHNETGSLIWSDTIITNIPTGPINNETSQAVVAFVNGGTTAQILAYYDYMSVGINETLKR